MESLLSIKRRLVVLQARLEAQAAAPGIGPVAGEDIAGLARAAQLAAQQEADSALFRLLAERIRGLEHAAERARQGRCGICESCDTIIAAGRLQAVPHTTLCIACQRQQERLRGRRAASAPGAYRRTLV